MAAGDIPGSPPAAPVALYRKYRPATFAELRGQEHISEPLRQALRSGRVHHAYLFSGPRGCGKTSSARILARSLNCEQGPAPDPCGKCASCVALAPSGPGSIDVIEIDAASHGGVDDARDLRERAFYAPVSGRFKIYIVDEAHMVTREGFNALLKLVEEPPPHLKFVFATTEPEKVIPTIRSRTHHYAFRLMPPAILRGLLEEILASEGVTYQPEVLPVVVRAGAGSARDALSVLDQLLAGSGEEGLTYERAVALLGYTDDRLLDEVAAAFASEDGAAVFRAVNRVIEAGHDPRRFAADLLDRLRDLIILDAVPDAGQTGLLDIPADRLERMREEAASFGQAKLARAAETINAGLVEMRGAASPRLQLELICAQVLLPPASSGPPAESGAPVAGSLGAAAKALLARVERLERLLAPGRAAAPETPAQRVAPPAVTPDGEQTGGRRADAGRPPGSVQESGGGQPGADGIREHWPEVLEAVKRERRVAWILLSNATVGSLQDGVLTLSFTREGEARGFTRSGYEEDLKTVLAARFGISPRIKAVSTGAEGGGSSAGRTPSPAGGGKPGVGGGAVQAGAGGGATGGSQADSGGSGAGGADVNGSEARAAGPGNPEASERDATGAGNVRGEGADRAGAGRPGAGRPGAAGASARRAAGGGGGRAGGNSGSPDEPESDDANGATLAGMDLIQRELGGEVIADLDGG
jgi:DNA polymerase III subunit gamma/tau